jgi:uncharacterized sporulation protein YeaH/YhbH (DUF444 family)
MSIIIDRRKNNKKGSLSNRNRYIQRQQAEIRAKIYKSLKQNSILNTDLSIPVQVSTHEPTFHFESDSGVYDFVIPGNDEFMTGDVIKIKGQGQGQGGGNGEAGQGEDSEDGFMFNLTEDEYLDILFEGMELPNLEKVSSSNSDMVERHKAGFQNEGSSLDLTATFKKSIMRRVALEAPLKKKLKELEELYALSPTEELLEEINLVKYKLSMVLFIDDVDVRFKRYEDTPIPMSKMVIFFVLDVSGSVDEYAKERAKRFYLLTYLFLKRMYEKHEIVFITFTDSALEVDEEEFFRSMRSGGTLFSSGLSLNKQIIEERYPPSEWNIYTVFCTDGDNTLSDMEPSSKLFKEVIDLNQLFIYGHLHTYNDSVFKSTQIKRQFEHLQNFDYIELKVVDDVLSEFRKVFGKKGIHEKK